jgi:hypothetical protein
MMRDPNFEPIDWQSTLVWIGVIVAVLVFWAGVGVGIYYWRFHDDGPKVVCTESARGPHGATFDTGTAITCERR